MYIKFLAWQVEGKWKECDINRSCHSKSCEVTNDDILVQRVLSIYSITITHCYLEIILSYIIAVL